jgi:hypothetical protein
MRQAPLTCSNTLSRSRGAVAVLLMAPATAPAKRYRSASRVRPFPRASEQSGGTTGLSPMSTCRKKTGTGPL